MKKWIALFLVLFILSSASAVGLGAGGSVFLKDVLRGGFATSRLSVNNPNPYPITVGVWLTGTTADWTTLSPAPEYTLAPKEQIFVDVLIQPPAFVTNGVYTGQITFIMTGAYGSAGQGTGVSINAGSSIGAVVEVSDKQITSYQVVTVKADRTEECKPINIRIASKNNGNVNLVPTYDISLYHNQKGFVESVSVTEPELKPTLEREDTVTIGYTTNNLTGTWQQFLCLPAGDYYADIKAFDQNNKQFFTGKVPVYILQKGALSVNGALESLDHKENAKLGEPVKVTGVFNNMGDSSEQAKLKLEVYKGDRLVEIINGEEVVADPGKLTNVTAYFTPKELGNFKILGSVNFGGKFTNTIESSLKVELGLTIVILLIAIPLAILIIAIIIWLRMRRGY